MCEVFMVFFVRNCVVRNLVIFWWMGLNFLFFLVNKGVLSVLLIRVFFKFILLVCWSLVVLMVFGSMVFDD